jgi:methylthioribose-1-phosphate isomerase
MKDYFSIKWIDGTVRMIDQRLLPHEEKYLDYQDYREVAEAIQVMVIRGAPAIGAAAAYGLALAAAHSKEQSAEALVSHLADAGEVLRKARPTAVNLAWALDRVLKRVRETPVQSADELRQVTLAEAQAIFDEDAWMCRQISRNAQEVVPDPVTFIHHCNTGALAVTEYGTALGVIRKAHEMGKKVFAYVDETRPRLQGGRLTSWEFKQLGVPHAVIVDSASGHIMRTKKVDVVTVGCDRIAANGDVANKIGTYNLALAARAHNIPCYSVGPTSTIDLNTPTGDDIPIEERPAREVTHVRESQITPDGVQIANPAFDVTPAEYITGIITEQGIAYPPYEKSLAEMVALAEKKRLEK